jgi:hypothetical protein
VTAGHLISPLESVEETTMDIVNVDTHFASLYTIFDPINPQGREFFSV